MNNYHTLFYDAGILQNPPLDLNKYKALLQQVKTTLNLDKIIHENAPHIISNSLHIDRERLITENNDKLLIFAVGKPNTISVLWMKYHNKYNHVSVFNGKAIIMNSIEYLQDIEVKQLSHHLFSCVLCDFKHYNIKKFSDKHNSSNFNINDTFNII